MKGETNMEPEVIMNLWIFIQKIGNVPVIYELGIRPYMVTGSDDEKFKLLKDLAISDFHFARRFPLPPDRYYVKVEKKGGIITATSSDFIEDGPNVRKGIALVRPDISGVHQIEYFREALDEIEKSLPTRILGKNGKQNEVPKVNRGNLLFVITNVNVDEKGNQIPNIKDSRLNSPYSEVANLWLFNDEKAKEIYAISGRGYLVHGTNDEKTRILKTLAPYDFPMVESVPKTNLSSASYNFQKKIFAQVIDKIVKDVPQNIGIDGEISNPIKISSNNLLLNATLISEYSSNLGNASPVQLKDEEDVNETKKTESEIQAPIKRSFFQKLFGK